MATKKTSKAKTKPRAKAKTAKVESPSKKSPTGVAYLGRTQEAIAETRTAISRRDCLSALGDIDDRYEEVFINIMKNPRPTHDDTKRWKYSLDSLDLRSKNQFKLLDKLAPTFMQEELLPSEGGKGAVDTDALREQAIDKLAKALKPKSKVTNIKDAK